VLSIARSVVLVLLSAGLVACGGASSSTTTTTAPTAVTFADQVEQGGALYGAHCASCHGAAGEGGGAPRVVGLAEGALPLAPREGSARTSSFTTVGDVAGFAVATMPPAAPGSLEGAEYWAILAFDLHANGIDLAEPLTPELAATLTIPR
jgi:mono/diheme cytochrome c family protein